MEQNKLSHVLIRDPHEFNILACCAVYHFCVLTPVGIKIEEGCYHPPRARQRQLELRRCLNITHGYYFPHLNHKSPRLTFSRTYYITEGLNEPLYVNCTLIRSGGPHNPINRQALNYTTSLLDAEVYLNSIDSSRGNNCNRKVVLL